MSEERLDEETERLITAYYGALGPLGTVRERRAALRQRIRVLVEEARKEGRATYRQNIPL